jgi:uncharacterized protein YaaQ
VSKDLGKFLRRALVFIIPIVIYASFIRTVDPYNYFSATAPENSESKKAVSFKLNYAMWKILEYRRTPQANILLGDSRMMEIDSDSVLAVSGMPYSNLAYGGGSLREAIDTFWLATEMTKLNDVVIGINLNTFNDNDRKNRVSEVRASMDNPLIYFVNRNVLTSAIAITKNHFSKKDGSIGVPKMSRDEFWRHQLDVTTKATYSNYAYPRNYLLELDEINRYCDQNNIGLSFLIFPSHQDLRDQAKLYQLEDHLTTMVSELAAMGIVYNFDFDNPLTQNAENFKDPYHFNHSLMELIIQGVWGEGNSSVRVVEQSEQS